MTDGARPIDTSTLGPIKVDASVPSPTEKHECAMRDKPALWTKMRALAASDHPRAAELHEKADAFETAAKGYFGLPQTHTAKQFFGAYARARILWIEITVEPLV